MAVKYVNCSFKGNPWRVARSGIRVIGVNFDEGKRNFVPVSGVFELFEFELAK